MKYLLPLALVLLLGCSEEEGSECNSSFLLSTTVTDARCGQANGAITITARGATGTVNYRLDNEPEQRTATFDGLPPGNYRVSVQDETGCTIDTEVTVADQAVVIAAITTVTASVCGEKTGGISVAASGGVAPYTYRLDSADFAAAAQFEQLAPGEYALTVRDADGCTALADARVPSGVSFEATIQELITTNCAVTGCHVAPRVPNFTVADDIFAYADKIKERTGERSMPPSDSGRKLTDEQIAQIACWADDGAPDN